MCGIIGILGEKDVAPLLVDGLKRLEYRGYDSAGVATVQDGSIDRRRAQGKLVNLADKLGKSPLKGRTGIGHTRWATHGKPTEDNAHPHAAGQVAVVHNGIIENHKDLRSELEREQCRFESETDTEVIAHLINRNIVQGMKPRAAANAAFDRLRGAFAVVVIFSGEDDLMIGVRQGTPLAIGYGEGEMYLASDSYALAPLTKKICFLEDGDRVSVTRKGAEIYINDNVLVERPVRVTAQSGASMGKGPYRHFMLKEIHEQPEVIGETLSSFLNPATNAVHVPDDILQALEAAPRVTLIACGTASYACMCGKYWLETLAKKPCEMDIASEFRYREPPLPAGGLAVFVSQSGETLDTLEALRYCKRQGQKTLAIVNTIESTIEREADYVLHTLAGPEIGVASTKAFTTQLTVLGCLTLALAEKAGHMTAAAVRENTESLRQLPKTFAGMLQLEEKILKAARDISDSRDMLYLGRGALYPIAMEGALKMKEISYIHAEGYAAGEMKHGPIALIDESVPVIVCAPGDDPLFEKTLSNCQETAARGGRLMLFTDAKGVQEAGDIFEWVIELPDAGAFVWPILYSLPLQLLAYHTAVVRGTDVDQPRNLAKSVTVE